MVGHMEFDMGTRFEYVTRDYAKAREFYEKSIEHGYGLAMFNLGMYIVNGGEDALVRIIYLLARSLALFVSEGKKCTYIHIYILKSLAFDISCMYRHVVPRGQKRSRLRSFACAAAF